MESGLPAVSRRADVTKGHLSLALMVQLDPECPALLLDKDRGYKKLLSSPAFGPPRDLSHHTLTRMSSSSNYEVTGSCEDESKLWFHLPLLNLEFLMTYAVFANAKAATKEFGNFFSVLCSFNTDPVWKLNSSENKFPEQMETYLSTISQSFEVLPLGFPGWLVILMIYAAFEVPDLKLTKVAWLTERHAVTVFLNVLARGDL
ncbi:hypothetical protein llap_3462 [Limosa lapponica baueri]|uniref:Uncharacterized protein n=1 Tax=Limosa lapponica baueri TaxID=1758121 RepID=A0A2I0UJQ9_LIMLA|nr:hypothetical protein llap_3462 [Limosa lapponica baueri]